MSYRIVPTLLLSLASAAILHAQSDYTVQVSTQAYSDLAPAHVIGRGDSIAQAYSLHAGFTFRPYDSLFDLNTSNVIITRNGYVTVDNAKIAWIMDVCLGSYVPLDSSSSIAVQLVGSMAGTRTLKFQWKNMRPANNPAGDFVNFQLWLAEADNSIEVHIGPRHLTGFATWNDSGPAIGMFLSTYSLSQFYHQIYLKGDPADPAPSLDYADVLAPLTNPPADGMVYRFAHPKQGAGVDRVAMHAGISFQPNPARGPARITLPEEIAGKDAVLHLYDALGREAMTIGDLTDGMIIPSGKLPRGIYFAVITSGARRYDAGRFVAQ
jgi:hypothetical protein